MRNSFLGYYKPLEVEFNDLWENCIFALDANVLLNLYRYSKDTREELISLLDKFKKQIWLPYQAGFEFHQNRLKVISDQEEAYDKLVSQIEQIQNKLESELNAFSKHPLINSKKIKTQINNFFQKIKGELNKTKEQHPQLLEDDKIKEYLTKLFDGKVGKSYDDVKLKELFDEGKKRFERGIPPGYKDKGKDDDKQYGDFILWQQLIDKGLETKKPIIFITDDRKDDWWSNYRGKTIGPRPELVEEMQRKANIKFYMYQTDPFMERAAMHLKQKVNAEALQEIRNIRKNDEIANILVNKKLQETIKNLSKYNNLFSDNLFPGLSQEQLNIFGNEEFRKSIESYQNYIHHLNKIREVYNFEKNFPGPGLLGGFDKAEPPNEQGEDKGEK